MSETEDENGASARADQALVNRAPKTGLAPSGFDPSRKYAGHGPHFQTGYRRGIRDCIVWLSRRADTMNDPHAKQVLNSAAFALGLRRLNEVPLAPPQHGEDE